MSDKIPFDAIASLITRRLNHPCELMSQRELSLLVLYQFEIETRQMICWKR